MIEFDEEIATRKVNLKTFAGQIENLVRNYIHCDNYYKGAFNRAQNLNVQNPVKISTAINYTYF